MIKKSVLVFSVVIVVAGCATQSDDDVLTFNATAKVVRGLNAPVCNGKNISNGAVNKPDNGKVIMDNLSVNCSATKDFKDLYKAGSANQYLTTLGQMRKQNSGVTLVSDKVNGNPDHCLVSGITGNEFCQGGKIK